MIVSPDGRILSYNRRFIEMWGIPEEVMESGSIGAARDAILDILADAEEFVRRVQYLYEHPDEECRDEVLLKDGRVFSRYSSSVVDPSGVHYGRGWYYRDISKQRQTEKVLAEETQRLASLVTFNPNMVA
jgi:PAS domain-containing protein